MDVMSFEVDKSFADLSISGGDSGDWILDGGGSPAVQWSAQNIPEPSSLALIGLAAFGALLRARRH